MDGKTLMEIMQSPNFSMWQPAQDAFQLGQDQNKATLADTLQKTQQSAAMHPLKMKTEEATAANLGAQTRNSNALAAGHEDALKILQAVPQDQRVKAYVSDMTAKMTKNDLDELTSQMTHASGYAAKALANGGRLPLEDMLIVQQKFPQFAKLLSNPQGAKTMANMVTEFNKLQPARQQSDYHTDVMANAQRYGADQRLAAAQAAAAKGQRTKTLLEILASKKTAAEQLNVLNMYLPTLPPEEQQEWAMRVETARRSAGVEDALKLGQKIDPVQAANGGGIQATVPPMRPNPIPGAAPKPAQPASQLKFLGFE